MKRDVTKREGARCSTHGLAAGPDGRCTLCRREGAASGKGGRGVVIAAAAVAGLGIVGYLAYRHYRTTHRIDVSPNISPVPNKPAIPQPAVVARKSKPVVEQDWRRLPDKRHRPTNLRPYSRRKPARRVNRFALPTGASREQWLKAMRRVPITLYCSERSGICNGARAWLGRNRFRVINRDIDSDTAARGALRGLNPRLTVPTLQIDGKVMTGFSATRVWQALVRVARRRLGL